jgi:hypothetical protein
MKSSTNRPGSRRGWWAISIWHHALFRGFTQLRLRGPEIRRLDVVKASSNPARATSLQETASHGEAPERNQPYYAPDSRTSQAAWDTSSGGFRAGAQADRRGRARIVVRKGAAGTAAGPKSFENTFDSRRGSLRTTPRSQQQRVAGRALTDFVSRSYASRTS